MDSGCFGIRYFGVPSDVKFEFAILKSNNQAIVRIDWVDSVDAIAVIVEGSPIATG
jgi:hypothetical protein